MRAVLREVIPDGTQWGIKGDFFPDWLNLEFGQDLKDGSSLSFDYANDGVNASKLKPGIFLQIEFNNSSTWFDSIFYCQEMSGALLKGSTERRSRFACVSLRKLLSNVRWMPALGSEYMDEDAFKYVNVTPGDVIKAGIENFWSRAKSKYGDPMNWLSSVTVLPGTAWEYLIDETVGPTTSISEILDKYQELGIATARFHGFQLQLSHYNWGKADTSHIVDAQLRVGWNLREGEVAVSNTDVVTALLVKGSRDPFKEDSDVSSYAVQWVIAPSEYITEYGYLEGILEISDASSPDTLQAVGRNYIRTHLEPRRSTSYAMVNDIRDYKTGEVIDNIPLPLVDFQCGDTISVFNGDSTEAEKVYAISVSYGNHGTIPEISLTLNDYFDNWQVKFDQRLRRLEA